jgi:hypothetical protein
MARRARVALRASARVSYGKAFNLAIDRKLRARDVVALKVEDVAPNGIGVMSDASSLSPSSC